MRFRFCLNGISESVFCIFPNQILVENHRRSALELHSLKKKIGVLSLGIFRDSTATMQHFRENIPFLLYCQIRRTELDDGCPESVLNNAVYANELTAWSIDINFLPLLPFVKI